MMPTPARISRKKLLVSNIPEGLQCMLKYKYFRNAKELTEFVNDDAFVGKIQQIVVERFLYVLFYCEQLDD